MFRNAHNNENSKFGENSRKVWGKFEDFQRGPFKSGDFNKNSNYRSKGVPWRVAILTKNRHKGLTKILITCPNRPLQKWPF